MSIMSRVNALKPQLYMQNHAEHHYANTSKGLWVQVEKNVNENKEVLVPSLRQCTLVP